MPAQSKILVVDDERPMREMLRLGLERQGYVVQDLPDGRGLQDVVVQWQPDAIVLDVMMPFADGFALLPMIRRTTQAPRDHADREDRRRRPRDGARAGGR